MTILLEGGKKVPAHEHYITPDHFATWPVQHLLHPGPQDVLDAGAGTGPYGKALEEYGNPENIIWGVDIRDVPNPGHYDIWINNTDYLTWPSIKMFGTIIGNPPFSLGEEWIRKSMDLLYPDGRLILLLQQNFLASEKRLQLWEQFPPMWIVTCANRPRFYGKTTGDNIYMYVVWEKGWNGSTKWTAKLME